jgi:phosphopantothenoylcysteine decarboxylase/phosphopantothenate--cysteine ligase
MPDAAILSYARTPIGKAFRGALNLTHGATLGAHVLRHAVQRAGIEAAEVEDVVLGCAFPEGANGFNVGRISALAAGFPEHVSGMTVNRYCSSGLQSIAIAAQAAGADVTLVSGPVELRDPAGVSVLRVESARDMLHRVEAALPVDIAIFAAAVADWRVANEGEQKLKKTSAGMPPLQLVENPDILATISKLQDRRPPLVIGFAAETEHLIDNAKAKIARKGCDWIVANDVSPATGVMGGDRNTVHLLTREGSDIGTGNIQVDSWPVMTKEQVATELVARIAKTMGKTS